MLTDDAVVDALLERLDGAIGRDAVVVDHSTVAPAPTAARFARMHARGIAFLHAPVMMAPPAARQAGGLMMVSGARSVFDRVRDELSGSTGDLWYLGERPEKAAAMKLFGNEMLVTIVAGLADGYALARSAGITANEAFELFDHFKPQGALEFRGKKMAAGEFEALFELTMARKDVRLMLETVAANGGHLHFVPAIAARMDALIAKGHGAEDMSVLGTERE
jgi:3-hydroxyisobutyrate dehydrogenase